MDGLVASLRLRWSATVAHPRVRRAVRHLGIACLSTGVMWILGKVCDFVPPSLESMCDAAVDLARALGATFGGG